MEHPYFLKQKDFSPIDANKPQKQLGIVIVLPSYNEPELWHSLQALMGCKKPKCSVEVLVVINYPIGSSEEIEQNAIECVDLVRKANQTLNNLYFQFIPIKAFNLPRKHAGVGLARKIGMDQAAWRLLQSECKHKIIACFDADATCSKNYLTELEKFWTQYPDTTACSIRYEHPLEGNNYDYRIYQGIAQYELHLRYYVQAGRFIGHPFSYQTVGSSMACSAEAYLRFGGMNKNKAGEDFYFLQKIIPHGGFRELNSACIYPSPRSSHRVPFGTGRAMTKFLEANDEVYYTYNLDSFTSIKDFIETAPSILYQASDNVTANYLNNLPEPLKMFLSNNNFISAISEINANTSTPDSFAKRFFLWFDAFKLLKFLNFAHENFYKKKPIVFEAARLVKLLKTLIVSDPNPYTLLSLYRQLEINNSTIPAINK